MFKKKRYIVTDSIRTARLLVFLVILITFPIIFSRSDSGQPTQLRATAASPAAAGGVVNMGGASISVPISSTATEVSVSPTSPSFPPEGAYYPDLGPWIFIIPGIIIFIGFFFY